MRLLFSLHLLCLFCFSNISHAQSNQTSTPECTSNEDCSFNGDCSSKGKCVCDKGYTQLPEGAPCSYEQKDQLTAFGLSIFLGYVGVGRFYVGNFLHGAFKAGLTLGSICTSCIVGSLLTCAKCKQNDVEAVIKAWSKTSVAAGTVWYFVDIFLFGFNNIKDENNQKLKEW